jgi:7,8-dihydropterin-6-yl-methyl-4-(beta-D-ribofuranosyl)aminobenzene 5'-phosphate synthase
VVLSHDHWDHISGLTGLLAEPVRERPLEVFVPAAFSTNLKEEIAKKASLTEVESVLEVSPGVFSTGQLGEQVKEQSLVLSHDGRSLLLTGCAHPGIDTIVRRAREIAEIAWLVGGLHGAKAEQIPDTLERVVICHCTKDREAIARAFGDRAVFGRAGDRFALEW